MFLKGLCSGFISGVLQYLISKFDKQKLFSKFGKLCLTFFARCHEYNLRYLEPSIAIFVMYYKRAIFAKSQLIKVKEVDRKFKFSIHWASIKDSITTLRFSVNINVAFLHLLTYFDTFLKNIVFRFQSCIGRNTE